MRDYETDTDQILAEIRENRLIMESLEAHIITMMDVSQKKPLYKLDEYGEITVVDENTVREERA
jgi:hypothetical protein